MNVQPNYISDANGNRISVVLDIDTFRNLLELAECAEDIKAGNEAVRQLEAGEDELIPSEIVDRLLSEESNIKVWREYRGLNQQNLADQVGITKSYLSQIETGKKPGSVDKLAKIADALNVDLDDLV